MTPIVIYIDIDPKSTPAAISLLRAYRDATRAEDGNLKVIVLDETSRQNRFVVIEAWGDEARFQAHEAAPHVSEFRTRLRAIHNSPYDQRVHHEFTLAPEQQVTSESMFWVVTHVDVPPPRKDETEVLLTVEAAKSRADAGNIRYDVFQQNAPRTNHFTVMAIWNGEAAFALHQAMPHTRQYREALGPMLGAPYDERLYRSFP
jgi:quinol monooxygenase YgiN